MRSMTPRERRDPSIIDGSRRTRIARGSGTSVSAVNQLLKQFTEMRKMMRQMGSGAMPADARRARTHGEHGRAQRAGARRVRCRRASKRSAPAWRAQPARGGGGKNKKKKGGRVTPPKQR